MINSIPIIGWFIDLCFKISLAIPFWIVWVGFGVGKDYFDFLPEKYLNIGFWTTVGIFIVVPIIYGVFIPKIASVSQTVEK